MIWATHPFWDQGMTASTADGTLTIRQCTCSFTWGTDGTDGAHVIEVRRPGLACPVHPEQRVTEMECQAGITGMEERCVTCGASSDHWVPRHREEV